MERRFAVRFHEMTEGAVVPSEQLVALWSRLEQFVVPFSQSQSRIRQRSR